MTGEIKIGTVSDPPKLAPAEGEEIFKIRCGFGVVGELFGAVIAQAQMLFTHSEREEPLLAEGAPILKPFKIGSGFTEEFKLHLFKLTGAEGEVSGCDLIAE